MLPTKLKDDAIIEALCEVRFDADEQPEIVIGRLSDHSPWKEYSKGRLPVADVPLPIRSADINLKYQPVLQLRSTDGTHLVKIGSNVISFHNTGTYDGWKKFQPQLVDVFNKLFESLGKVRVIRLGFRYINALTSKRHHVSGIGDLDLSIRVADSNLADPVNLNYSVDNTDIHRTMTRIASPVFVNGKLPEDTRAVVDIDVSTPPGFETSEIKSVINWTESAHEFEKQAFFKLIPKPILDKLVES